MSDGSEPRSSPNITDTEHQLKALIEAVTDYAIYTLDTQGSVATWNTGAERIKGYSADEIIGKDFSVFYTDEDRRTERHLVALHRRLARAATRPRAGAFARMAADFG